jgi:hypothetical protein
MKRRSNKGLMGLLLSVIAMIACMGGAAIAAPIDAPPKYELPTVEILAIATPAQPEFELAMRVPIVESWQDPGEGEAPWSIAGYYSFKRQEWSLIATNRIDVLWSDLGGRKGVNIELHGIVGGNADTGLVGGGLQLTIPLHPRITFALGAAVTKNNQTLAGMFESLAGFELGATASIVYALRF